MIFILKYCAINKNRRAWMKTLLVLVATVGLGKGNLSATQPDSGNVVPASFGRPVGNWTPGAFSLSLTVKDLVTSRTFYDHLGFTVFGGSMQQSYLIMKNRQALIGLFQGMFSKNIITFNPRWDNNAKPVECFDDIRKIQQCLKSKGINLDAEAGEKTSVPASLMLTDPDGNQILLDQHV